MRSPPAPSCGVPCLDTMVAEHFERIPECRNARCRAASNLTVMFWNDKAPQNLVFRLEGGAIALKTGRQPPVLFATKLSDEAPMMKVTCYCQSGLDVWEQVVARVCLRHQLQCHVGNEYTLTPSGVSHSPKVTSAWLVRWVDTAGQKGRTTTSKVPFGSIHRQN